MQTQPKYRVGDRIRDMWCISGTIVAVRIRLSGRPVYDVDFGAAKPTRLNERELVPWR